MGLRGLWQGHRPLCSDPQWFAELVGLSVQVQQARNSPCSWISPFPWESAQESSASLVHLDCRCPCLSVCGGCHCNRQRGRSSELDERLGCCEGSLLLVPVRVLAYTVCFSLRPGLPPLSPNCPCRCAHCQLCAHPNVLLPLLILAAQVCFVSPLTCIARSPLELLTAFRCPRCPASCGTLLLPILSCKQT